MKHYIFSVIRPEPRLGTPEAFHAGALATNPVKAAQVIRDRYPTASSLFG